MFTFRALFKTFFMETILKILGCVLAVGFIILFIATLYGIDFPDSNINIHNGDYHDGIDGPF